MVKQKNALRSLILAVALMLVAPVLGGAGGIIGVQAANAQTVARIAVDGNQRVDDGTVISYLSVRVGEKATSAKINASIDSLYASGLFSNVSVAMSGSTLAVRVAENPIVASVLFEGNRRFSDAQLLSMVDMGSRGVFTDDRLKNDVESIRLAYDRDGYSGVSVTARSEVLDNGRVRVVFVVNEGDRAGIAAINFTGNNTFSSGQLKDNIKTKETHLLSWLFRDDSYDEEKLSADKELIRLFYANHGFPDAQVLSAVAEFDANRNAYFINFTISEGERYKFGAIGIETSIPGMNAEALKSTIRTSEGGTYNYTQLSRTASNMAYAANMQGFSFADVRPRIDRDIANRTFNVTFLVDQGPRVYVERIDITGNTKTRDFVIRRELDFAEGDPFTRSLALRGKENIEKLDFFDSVDISTAPGSASDKIVIHIAVVEKSTGDYGATIGYSTADGVLGELSLTERNFLGRGQYLRVAVGATQNGNTFDFSFTEPRFMGLKISSGVDLYLRNNSETDLSFYGSQVAGGQLRFGMPITDEVSLTGMVGYERKTIDDNDATNADVVDGLVLNKAFVGYSLAYNSLDDQTRPTSGLLAVLNQQYAGWDHNYIRSEIKARYFVPINEEYRIIGSIKGQAGIINDLSGGAMSYTEAFYPGPNLVRGFAAKGLGPRLASGEAVGTLAYAGISAEIEFPMPVLPDSYGLSASVWADLGYLGGAPTTVAAVTQGIDQAWRASAGASIIWNSPFGPLRADFIPWVSGATGDVAQQFQFTIATLL